MTAPKNVRAPKDSEKKTELSEEEMNKIAGGRTEITREQWEKLASTRDFEK